MFTEECINTFLENQEQLFPQAVAESYEAAEAFLEDCMAQVVDSIEEVREYLEESGADVEGMSDEELEDASEVFALPDGKYLITRRRMDKEWAAGWWEVPGGGVRAGEDSKDAVIREIKEETGIDVTNAEGGYAFSYKRVNPEEKNNYFVDIYKFVLEFDESDVKTQEEEVSGFAIADLNEIKRYADEGIFLHYDSIRQAFEE